MNDRSYFKDPPVELIHSARMQASALDLQASAPGVANRGTLQSAAAGLRDLATELERWSSGIYVARRGNT